MVTTVCWGCARVAAMIVVVLLTLGGAVSDRATSLARACGPFIDFHVFTNLREPESPAFVAGELGVIQPTYRRRYLVAAWRTLQGRGLTKVEQQAYTMTRAAGPPDVHAVQTWMKARAAAPGVPAPTEVPQQFAMLTAQGTFAYIRNCGDSAFVTAATTLEDRRQRLGDGHPLVADWIRAQDAVFANCGRRADRAPSMPPPLPSDAPALARADRAYQIAAARFYAGQFADAEAAFADIARDPSSPWHTTAPYLAARAMVRQGTIGGPTSEGDPAAMARALVAVNTILNDGTRRELHQATRRLRQFIVTRTQPRDVLLETAAMLTSPAHADGFAEHLEDFEYILNRTGISARGFETLAARNDAADLLDWIATVQRDDDGALGHALQRWDDSRTAAWLVAAAIKVPAGHRRQAELLSAASVIAPASPAYPTLAFHSARVLLRGGNHAEAREVLNRALGTSGLPVSAVNLLKAARIQTAGSLDEFLADAVRTSLGEVREAQTADARSAQETRMPASAVLDLDTLAVVNETLPLATLRQIATSPTLPANARRELLQAVFTRALLLDDLAAVRELLPGFTRSEPSLSGRLARLETRDDQRLRDEGALLLLRTPGLRPYVAAWSFRDNWPESRPAEGLNGLNDLRDNWWCRFEPAIGSYYTPNLRPVGPFSAAQAGLHGDAKVSPPSFLTDQQRRRAADERRVLESLDSGPNELGRRVLDWARRNPTDARVPEYLHRVVRATRVGCTTEATGAISRAAFEWLHARYPTSPWTARTPHWFK